MGKRGQKNGIQTGGRRNFFKPTLRIEICKVTNKREISSNDMAWINTLGIFDI